MKIKDLTALTAHQRHRKRGMGRVKYQVWHRTHLYPAYYDGTPEEFVAFWADRDMGTGGRTPYHYIIKPDGVLWHFVPLDRVAPGAAPYNTRGVQVAIEQDMRKTPPTPEQWETAKKLARELYLKGIVALGGHTELVPSKDKVCPGKYLDTSKLRQCAAFGDWENENT